MCNIAENLLIGFHSPGLPVNPGKRNQLATAPCRSAYNMASGRYGLVFTLAWFSCMSLMLFRTPGEGAAPQALSLQPEGMTGFSARKQAAAQVSIPVT